MTNPNIENMPMRIQFCCGHKLVAEVIVPHYIMDATYAAYVNLKYKKHMHMGGAMMGRADLKRYWDIPVGTTIKY